MRLKYDQIVQDLQDNQKNMLKFKNMHEKNEAELRNLEHKLDDAKFNQVKLEDKLRERDREIIYLTDRLNNQNISSNGISEKFKYDDAKYVLKSTLTQKQEEVKELLAENKTLKIRLSERPES